MTDPASLPTALTGFTAWSMNVAFWLTGLALLIAFLRLLRGPTLADRVVAIDLITMIVVLLLTLFGMAVDDGAYLDAAIALGLVAFLATVAFARYIERLPRAHVRGAPDTINDYRVETRAEGTS